MLVERTNMYAEEKGAGKKMLAGVAFGRPWKKVTPEEMRVFVALVIYMRANRYCGSKGFWRDQEENRQVLRLMNLKCFGQINRHQQKKPLLQTERHCVWTQEIRLEHPVHPVRPQMAPAQWLHPSPLGAIQPASCPPSAPGWSISHPNLAKKPKVSDP